MSKTRRKNVRRTRKQKIYNMKGCSKKRMCSSKNKTTKCTICGPNCRCGPNCSCPPNCPGNCCGNCSKKMKGGSGCGSCGCPIAPLSYKDTLNYQKGGNCSTCQSINVVQNGGYGAFFKPSLMPGPIVGKAWGPSNNQLPGMNGVGGDRNFLANYGKVIVNDPTRQMMTTDAGYLNRSSMVGGYSYPGSSNNHIETTSGSNTNSSTIGSGSNTDSSAETIYNELNKPNKKISNKKISNKKYKSRGGGLIPQDLVNLGRDVSFNFKSVSNALNGYPQPVSDLPYQGQFPNSNKL